MPCCCSCKNLDEKQRKAGETSGAKYYCKKHKTLVSGDTTACEKYESCFRSNSDIEKIYKEGKTWSNDTTSVGGYIALLVILIIALIILKLLKPELF